MPLLDDWIAEGSQQAETFRAEVNAIDIISAEVASTKFPGIEMHDSPNICYFPFRLCHSLPQVNERQRAFAPAVLERSFASLNDQLIDWEHELKDNGIGSRDRIIGCVKTVRFAIPPSHREVANDPKALYGEMANTMDALPVDGLGLLFMRAQGVSEAVRAHMAGKEKWSVSMECGHRWKDGGFLYRGEYIPYMSAELAMRDCVSPGSVRPFKGHKLVACLGGMDSKVDFWGVGFTRSPADTKAEVYSFAAGRSRELSSRNIFVMPFQVFSGMEAEVASKADDKKETQDPLIELASLDILGETNPDEPDGHSHTILSNLTVVPHQGHTHSLSNVHISRGSNPTVSGHTDTHYNYGSSPSDVSTGKTHLHLVKIPLKGKYKPSGSEDTSHLEPIISEQASKDMDELLRQLLAKQQEILSRMTGVAGADATKVQSELASVGKEIADALKNSNRETELKAFLDGEVKAGRVVTKEVADAAVATAVTAAVSEADKKHADELAAEKKRADRLAKCGELNIDLTTEFEGVVKADGKTMTVRDRLDLIPTDEAGDQQFAIDSQLWATAAPKDAPVVVTTPAAEAPAELEAAVASKGGAAKKVIKRVTPIAGAGPTGDAKTAEIASAHKDVPSHLLGRRAFAAPKK